MPVNSLQHYSSSQTSEPEVRKRPAIERSVEREDGMQFRLLVSGENILAAPRLIVVIRPVLSLGEYKIDLAAAESNVCGSDALTKRTPQSQLKGSRGSLREETGRQHPSRGSGPTPEALVEGRWQ